MQLRHISPRSSDWVDAMDDGRGGRGWEKLAPEELTKLRASAQMSQSGSSQEAESQDGSEGASDDYGWGDGSASR
jgi:hypothetical protein